ncbi:MAG: glycoside hydrolase family 13 protein [Bacillota bacterium]
MKHLLLFLLLSCLITFNNFFSQSHFPEWAKGIVWYQIFPERFANGDTSNDPRAKDVFINRPIPEGWKKTSWTSNWFSESDWEKKIDSRLRDKITMRRYGGDIQGIIDHLDYIKSLGVGAIYFNPIFESISMHKYDASTYHHIDASYGPDPEGDRRVVMLETPEDSSTWVWTKADKLFLKLIKEVHKRGMKIIIDGVFNHTGTEFWAFKDIMKNHEKSKYFDWYEVRSFDDTLTKDKNELDYRCWWNYKAMPEFNRTKDDLMAGPKNYIFNITRRWMDPDRDGSSTDGIDGWRLDVAREVPLGFWRDWNRLVKSINNEAYIVGELWELSDDFVGKGDVFDALMNYNFAYAVNSYFIAKKDKVTTSEFIDQLKEIDATYPENTLYILQNLADSHDTDRLSSMIKNPDRKFDKEADENNPDYNPGKPTEEEYEKQKLIAAFQLTYRGAPMIYYGDEAGMWGADDPHDRKPMLWEGLKYEDEVIDKSSGFKAGFGTYKVQPDKGMIEFYKKIIALHNESPALKKGKLEFIYSNDKTDVFAFSREFTETNVSDKRIVVFNLGEKPETFLIKENKPAEELLNPVSVKSEQGKLKITIPPKSVHIYKIKTDTSL